MNIMVRRPTILLLTLLVVSGKSSANDDHVSIRAGSSMPRTTITRELSSSYDNVEYDYYVDMEQDVEEGSSADTDEGPPDDTIICIERSMASHMDRSAEAYFVEQKNYPPSGGKWWMLERITYRQGTEEIILIVKNLIRAWLKKYEGGRLSEKEKVRLGSDDRRLRDLSSTATTTDAKRERRRRKRRKTANRRWVSKLRNKVKCQLCDPDKRDAARALQSNALDERRMPETSFENWMNVRIQHEIVKDCPQMKIISSIFSRLEDGKVIRTSDASTPDYGTVVANAGPREKQTSAPQPATTPTSVSKKKCCSEDGKTCMDSEYCNRDKTRCKDKCDGNWMKLSKTTKSPTSAPTPAPKEESNRMCCSDDKETCKESEYCNRSKDHCEEECEDHWIDPNNVSKKKDDSDDR